MDAPATAAQPTEQMDMGALQSAPRHPHPGGPNPTSLSQRTLCRHTSKVGTVCVNRASTGLCGGYRAPDIPTATPACACPGRPVATRLALTVPTARTE